MILSRMWSMLAGIGVVLGSAGVALAAPPSIEMPEPTSLALIAAAVGGMAWIKFRREK